MSTASTAVRHLFQSQQRNGSGDGTKDFYDVTNLPLTKVASLLALFLEDMWSNTIPFWLDTEELFIHLFQLNHDPSAFPCSGFLSL